MTFFFAPCVVLPGPFFAEQSTRSCRRIRCPGPWRFLVARSFSVVMNARCSSSGTFSYLSATVFDWCGHLYVRLYIRDLLSELLKRRERQSRSLGICLVHFGRPEQKVSRTGGVRRFIPRNSLRASTNRTWWRACISILDSLIQRERALNVQVKSARKRAKLL